MSNSKHMTITDRLAQKLKESDIGSLIDEDDLIELSRDAIQKAFFTRVIQKQGYHVTESDPPIVAEARTIFAEEIGKRAKEVGDELMKLPEFKDLIRTAIAQALPSAIEGIARNVIHSVHALTVKDVMENVLSQLKSMG